MKFTLNWLNTYLPTPVTDPSWLADSLTMLGLEVEAVTELYPELAGLHTGLVTEVEPHPQADLLSLCRVSVGELDLRIVCGAPNVRAGLAVVVALPGTTLPGGIKIKKTKVRGVHSEGMICSERELGISDEHTGIMELAEDTPHGIAFRDAVGFDDTMIEVDLTPNRPDCASVIGIAREVAGLTRQHLVKPIAGAAFARRSTSFSVRVEADDLCPRYAAQLLTGITIGPSPWWLRRYLLAVGMRPINNVVDVTNYVMLEYGQPLHAFDFNTLTDKAIVVRTPGPDEKEFTTLDGVTRTLTDDMLMICDGEKPVAVGGVMGGLDSEVSDATVDVLLEAACFNPVSIRRTARSLSLSSEAAYRFERGVDPGGTLDALARATQLLVELTGCTAEDGGIDVRAEEQPANPIVVRADRSSQLLGITLSATEISELLEAIEIPATPAPNNTLSVSPPSFRVDLEREVDLIEEIARLVGFDNIVSTLPAVHLDFPTQDHSRILRLEAAAIMTKAGFSEAITYSFGARRADDWLRLAADDPRRNHIRILNPLTEDQDVMRTSLLPGLLESIRRNFNFQQSSCKLFEIGDVFFPTEQTTLPTETTHIAGLLAGNRYGAHAPLYFKAEPVDIFDAKGAVQTLLAQLRLTTDKDNGGIDFVVPDEQSREPFAAQHCCLSIVYENRAIGSLGKISADILRNFDIKREVYYFDLDFASLTAVAGQPRSFQALPVYPHVKRDLALVVPTSTSAQDLVETVMGSGEKLVKQCELFDIYEGEHIQPGHKSVAMSITYRSATRTLTEKQVEKTHAKLITLLSRAHGGAIREI
jgi:phenylalanyl-tRNA synthetase beta chain